MWLFLFIVYISLLNIIFKKTPASMYICVYKHSIPYRTHYIGYKHIMDISIFFPGPQDMLVNWMQCTYQWDNLRKISPLSRALAIKYLAILCKFFESSKAYSVVWKERIPLKEIILKSKKKTRWWSNWKNLFGSHD